MIEILDELTEIPFEIFWDKYQELKPNLFYNRDKAEIQWFRMKERDRIQAFTCLGKGHYDFYEPYLYLEYFDLPF
jgi:hypothetical protein